MDYVIKEDLRLALAPVATREEMKTAFAKLPTREEMRVALATTREEMVNVMREEGDRTRRRIDVVAQDLQNDLRRLAQGQVALHQLIDDVATELKADIAALDRRVMRLEATRGGFGPAGVALHREA